MNSAPRASPPNRADRWLQVKHGNRPSQIFYDELMPCVDLAAELKVLLLIEPEPHLMIETFGQYLQFAKRFTSPWVA